MSGPTVTFNKVFKKEGVFRRRIFWRKTNEYADVYEFFGSWNGSRFRKEMVFRRNRWGKWEKLHSYPEVWL